MKVIIKGSLNVDSFVKKLVEVADNTLAKVQAENEGIKVNGYSIHEAEVLVKFDVEGIDEPQVMTIEHHEGQPELLTWIVDTEKDELATNEAESLFDEWSAAQAAGKEHKFKEIATVYNDADLTYIPELDEAYSDMSKVVYEHKEGFRVVRVKQKGKLIQEYKLVSKE